MSKQKAEELYTLVAAWVTKHKPLGPESLWQVDKFNNLSIELAEKCCDIVGYAELEENE